MKFTIHKDSRRDKILFHESVSQLDLFAHFFQIPESDIRKSILNKSYLVKNNIRGENDTSLSFRLSGSRVKMHDFGSTIYRGDIFDLGAVIYNLNSNSPKDFNIICGNLEKIIKMLETNKNNQQQIAKPLPKVNHKTTDFKVQIRALDSRDVRFWELGGNIPISYLKSKRIYPIESALINDETLRDPIIYLDTNTNDIGYCYVEGKNKDDVLIMKLYFPNRDKSEKFRTNNKGMLELTHQLTGGDLLILQKSYKDGITTNYIIDKLYDKAILFSPNGGNESKAISNYSVAALTSESNRLTDNVVKLLKDKYKHIIIFTDFDTAGTFCGIYHKLIYGIDFIQIPNKKFDIDKNELKGFITQINKKLTENEKIDKEYIIDYVDNYSNDYIKEKDVFEYNSVHGVENSIELLKELLYERGFQTNY